MLVIMKRTITKSIIKVLCVSCILLLSGGFVISKQPALTVPSHLDIGTKFDAYGYLSFKEEKTRLDNLAIQLRSESRTDSKCFIAVFAGRGRYASQAKDRACRAKRYLIDIGGIDPKRVIAAALTNGSDE